ncbi:MAG: protein phosphatase 2C domain-containing protein [Bdellovibrionales bacterium]|nr:protein phosphatase 2C domain-containing protein [Bdellovibrionales bacterium]
MSQRIGRAIYNENCEQLEEYNSPWIEGVIQSVQSPSDKIENEDSAGVLIYDDFAIAMVADGLGGHLGGAQASRLAIETLAQKLDEWTGLTEANRPPRRETILGGIEAAHEAIKALNVGGGTTLTLAEVTKGWVRFYNAGDSFGMLASQWAILRYKNVEHSPVGYCLEAGAISEEEVIGHPASGIVLSALGIDPVRIEMSSQIPLGRRDQILLASDGLSDNVRPSEICGLLRTGSPSEKLAGLVKAARLQMGLEKGKPDDLTLVLLVLDRELSPPSSAPIQDA